VALSNFLVVILDSFLGLALLRWFILARLNVLFREKRDDPSFLLMQQQIEQPRVQVSQVFDNSAQLIQQQLGQMLGHVNERLKENAEVLSRT